MKRRMEVVREEEGGGPSESSLGGVAMEEEGGRISGRGAERIFQDGEDDAPPQANLTQEEAAKLFEQGAFFVLEDFPVGSELGIDYQSWTTGDRFKGLKMIPAGLHFVYFSAVGKSRKEDETAPRIGFFHHFAPKEVLAMRWNAVAEDAEALGKEEAAAWQRRDMREMDPFLGPYPLQSLETWFGLTNHLSWAVAEAVMPASGRLTTQCELTTAEAQSGADARVDRAHPTRLRLRDEQGLPIMHVAEGHQLRFRAIPPVLPPAGGSGDAAAAPTLSAQQRTAAHRDRSSQLQRMLSGQGFFPTAIPPVLPPAGGSGDAASGPSLEAVRPAGVSEEEGLLGEVQLAFVAFLVGRVYAGFEHWKRLLVVLSACDEALGERDGLFQALLSVVFHQLRLCPAQLFVDIVHKDNFLTKTLGDLFDNVANSDHSSEELRSSAARLKKYLERKFGWDFELDEDQPQLVHLPEQS